MSEDSTPNMKESLLETAVDLIPSCDSLFHDKDAEFKSDILRKQYENADQMVKDAMDIVVMAFTNKRLSAIIEINDKINSSNNNVG